jgi:membrane protease subunit HflC
MKPTRRQIVIFSGMLAAAVLAFSSFVVVDETEFAVITSFGRVAAVHGGGSDSSGVYLKAPWHVPVRIDRRVRVFDPPAREVMTGDKRNLDVAPYVVWRVMDPLVFLRGSGSHELAEARLNERVSAAISDAVGRRELAELASTDGRKWALDRLTEDVMNVIARAARDELGVLVLDVRLRRFIHPLEVRPAVFDLIRSERRQVAARLRAEGDSQYVVITSKADRARDSILAKAEAEAVRIKGDAEAESTRLLNEAHGRDPRFFEFLRTLESYRSILDERTTVVLSATSPLLRLMVKGPASDAAPGPADQHASESSAASAAVQKVPGRP